MAKHTLTLSDVALSAVHEAARHVNNCPRCRRSTQTTEPGSYCAAGHRLAMTAVRYAVSVEHGEPALRSVYWRDDLG